MSDTLHLPRSLVNHLLHLAQIAPGGRMAGLVGAKDGQAHTFHAMDLDADPASREAALEILQAGGETLFAILRLHPDSPAEPSCQEHADFSSADIPHFIISLNTKGVLELRAFQHNQPCGWQEIELVLLQE